MQYLKISVLKGIADTISQGYKFRDKEILFRYYLKNFWNLIKKEKINHFLSSNVTLKNKKGFFFAGNNIFSVYHLNPRSEEGVTKNLQLKEGVFVDIGANMGKHTIGVSKLLKEGGKVIAIEPSKRIIPYLKRNIQLNKLDNCTIVEKGCFNNKGFVNFNINPGTGGDSLIRKNKKTKFIEIEVEKLDKILSDLKINKVDLIKIDVEGAEDLILKGSLKTLKKSRPKIVFESSPENLPNIENILKKFDYKIKKIDVQDYLAY